MPFGMHKNSMFVPVKVPYATFVVNGRRFQDKLGTVLSYSHIVRLAQFSPLKLLTVTYKDGDKNGSIGMEGTIALSNGMIFNVADTSSA